ncbi:MAG: hypothetical protein OXB99_16125 [Acidimicrobiaceae bacterium]|nr:hypothetical protein [Acidimicrobiaceae bacterium]
MLAGICVTVGKSQRKARVTDRIVEELINDLFNMRDPSLDEPDSDEALQRMLSRMTYLQMPFQNEPWPPLMRTLCLYGDDPRFGPLAVDQADWQKVVGASVQQFLQVGFLMYAAAIFNDGAIHRDVFDPPRFDQIVHPMSISQALAVADRWLARSVNQLAAAGRAKASENDGHWDYNPFFEHPIALLDDGTYVMPSPMGILQRLSPQGVFFIIVEAINSGLISGTVRDFSDALGKRFERYIGVQLKQLNHATVHDEIAYDKGQKLSVDYIIETPEAIVLVEAKSRPPDEKVRSGVDLDAGKMGEVLSKACEQIDRSAQEIEQGNPKFPDQNGRPLRGLIITREQFYNLPMAFIGNTMPTASIPTSVWSSQLFEHAIPALIDDPDCGQRLLEALASDTDRLYTTTDPLPLRHDPLLKDLWEQWRIGWPQAPRAAA